MLVPNPTSQFGTDSLSFRTPADFAGGAIVWGPRTRIAFAYETGEFDDGADNNGNGLVDEGCVVLTRNAGAADEQNIVLCRHVREFLAGETLNVLDDNGNGVVDERGFNIRRVGDVLTIRLTIEDAGRRRTPYARTLQTSISVRN
jgi:hypothetical protein